MFCVAVVVYYYAYLGKVSLSTPPLFSPEDTLSSTNGLLVSYHLDLGLEVRALWFNVSAHAHRAFRPPKRSGLCC